jgi:uncharacterized protein YkwD
MPRIIVLALLALTAAAVLVPSTAAARERTLLPHLAADRTAHALGPLHHDRRLSRRAERHARRLARAGVLRHRPGRRLVRVARARWSGEVLAVAPSAAAAVRAWLRSPSHRAVLRSPRAARVGVGHHRGVWVAHLAARPARKP